MFSSNQLFFLTLKKFPAACYGVASFLRDTFPLLDHLVFIGQLWALLKHAAGSLSRGKAPNSLRTDKQQSPEKVLSSSIFQFFFMVVSSLLNIFGH